MDTRIQQGEGMWQSLQAPARPCVGQRTIQERTMKVSATTAITTIRLSWLSSGREACETMGAR